MCTNPEEIPLISLTFQVRNGKADYFRRGSTITLYATGSNDCPLAGVDDWLRHDGGGPSDALFRTVLGTLPEWT